MSSNPTPETIIREQLGHLGPFRGATGEKALDALVRERDRMGRLAEEQNNKLIAEMLRTEQAERDLGEARARLAGDRDLYEAAMNVLKQREREALAENERLRIRYGSFLDWAIGFVSSTVEPEDPEAEWFEIRRSWLQRLEGQLWEERAALAAAQEPPAKGDDRDE